MLGRTARALRLCLLGLAALLCAVLAGAQALLTLPGVREAIARRVEPLVGGALDAQLEIGTLDEVSLTGYVRASSVRLRSATGEPLAYAGRLEARIDLLALARGRIRLPSVHVDQAFVDLGAPLDEHDRRGLLGLFRDEPEADTAPERESGDDVHVALDDARVSRGRVLARFGDELWSAAAIDAAGEVLVDRDLRFAFHRARAHLARGGRALAVLRAGRLRYGPRGVLDGRVALARGDAKLVARGQLGEERDGRPRTAAARLRARGVSADTLAAFGLHSDVLVAPVDLELRAHGDLRALRWRAQLHTPGGSLSALGALDTRGALDATVQTDRLAPARFLRADLAELGGRVHVRAEAAPELPSAIVRAEITGAHYAGLSLPHTTAWARIGARDVVFERVVARDDAAGATLHARGRLDADGAFAADAELDVAALARLPVVQAYAPDLRGTLAGTVHATSAAGGPVHVQTALHLRDAGYGDAARARAIDVDGRLEGASLPAARVKLQVAAADVHVQGRAVRHAELELAGGPTHYRTRLTFDERGSVRARLTRAPRGAWRANASFRVPIERRAALFGQIAELQLSPRGALTVYGAQLGYRGARLHLRGRVDPDGRSALAARIRVPDLGRVTRPWLARPLSGTLALDVRADGPTRRPRLRVNADYRRGAVLGWSGLAAHLSADADLARGQLAYELAALRGGAALRVRGESRLAGRAPTLDALLRGRHALQLRANGVPLHELEVWPDAPLVPRRARLWAAIGLEGTLERFDARFDLRSELRFHRDPRPVRVAARGRYAEDELALELQARDERGLLLRSRVRTDLERTRFFAPPPRDPLDVLERHAWELSLWLGSRRVEDWPALHALQVHPALRPAQVAAHVALRHVPGREPEGDLRVRAYWDPPGEHADTPRCGLARPIRAVFAARMARGELHTELQGRLGGEQVLEVETDSQAPLEEWFALEQGRVRPARLRAAIADLNLAEVPVACELAGGRVSGSARVTRDLNERVEARVNLDARGLRLGDAPEFDAALSASADRDALLVWVDLAGEAGTAAVRGRVPIDAGGRMPMPDLDAPARLRVALLDLDARALLSAVPGVHATTGTVSAAIALRGPIRAPDAQGEVQLQNVSVTFPNLGQRFERSSGVLRLSGNTLHIERMRLRDRNGWADVSGTITMRDLESWRAELRAHANDFPVRRSGVMLAHVDGRLGVLAEIEPDRTELALSIDEADVALTGESLAGVQALDPLPDIVFVDRRAEDGKAETPALPGVTIVRVDARQPFWVRRQDFSALVRADLDIELRGETSTVRGVVEIERGAIELIGQLFDIERGRIEFIGGREAAPRLDLAASRRAPGGALVRVQATGPLDQPELTFAVDGEAVTAGEALAAATGSRLGPGSDASVERQIGSFATGIITGVFTLGARRELGEWLPVLAVERGGQGGTRLRAGVEADRLVPSFLRGLVVDAYLEGSLGTAPDAEEVPVTGDTTAGTQASVLLELRFRNDFVGTAQYGPAQRWSLDVTWEP